MSIATGQFCRHASYQAIGPSELTFVFSLGTAANLVDAAENRSEVGGRRSYLPLEPHLFGDRLVRNQSSGGGVRHPALNHLDHI